MRHGKDLLLHDGQTAGGASSRALCPSLTLVSTFSASPSSSAARSRSASRHDSRDHAAASPVAPCLCMLSSRWLVAMLARPCANSRPALIRAQ